ncbi:MAG: ABC-type transport system, permease component [Haloplasmataceae bacterium]|nr:ABC-type transport system, permease component [Haloplasmataceae bacterium]
MENKLKLIGSKLTNFYKKFNFKLIRKKLLGIKTTDGLLFKVLVYLILIGISYVFLFPLIKMVFMSFMSATDLYDPEVDWLPKKFTFEAFKIAFQGLNLPKTLFNSVWYSTMLAGIQTLIAGLTGFAFARYNFKFKHFWFAMVIFSFIIPVPAVMIPRILMFTEIGNYLKGIIDPNFTMFKTIYPQLLMTLLGQGVNNAILVLIFFNFFKMIPLSLDEAARMDGATSIQVFWHIFIKMSVPIIVTVFLFSFVWNWNESYTTNIFLQSRVRLLPDQLSNFEDAFNTLMEKQNDDEVSSRINESYRMAATFLSMVPLFIVYIFAQKQFIEGIERTGITGE